MAYERISIDHRVMGGASCLAGTRIPVATVVSMIAEGMSVDRIIAEFPQLNADAVREALSSRLTPCANVNCRFALQHEVPHRRVPRSARRRAPDAART